MKAIGRITPHQKALIQHLGGAGILSTGSARGRVIRQLERRGAFARLALVDGRLKKERALADAAKAAKEADAADAHASADIKTASATLETASAHAGATPIAPSVATPATALPHPDDEPHDESADELDGLDEAAAADELE